VSLEGKVVVVTGSTRGIGRAIAEECAREGARLVVSGRGVEASTEARDYLEACGCEATFKECDVRDYAQVESLRDHAIETFGRLDHWVNNAGIVGGYQPLDETPFEELGAVAETNLIGHLFGCRAAIPYFRRHGGVVLNLAGRGSDGRSTPFTATYACTKAAIASLTRSLAAENKDAPVSIHALLPGMVDTDMHKGIVVSDRLRDTEHMRHLAMEAFGVPLSVVGGRAAEILDQEPGAQTGKTYSLLSPGQRASGIAKMSWWSATGKAKPGAGQ
jgi:NAD(P)-dependent dehydrogenase (short-subunit alcohol dehydrogenase family)